MTWQIEKDESTASRRVIEFRTFKSDGTSPDTGSSNSSLRMSIGGNVQFTPNALVSAISANAGMYFLTLNQSDVSALGNHSLWYEGAFSQEVAHVQVVNTNLFSNFSNIAAKAYSGVTVEVNNLVGAFSAATVRTSGGTVDGVVNKVDLRAGTYSDVTVRPFPMTYSGLTVGINDAVGDMSSKFTVGVGIAAPSLVTVQASGGTVAGVTNKVDLRAGTYSNISLRLDTNAVPAGAFQADSIDATALAAMNLSDVTVRVFPMTYSGLTVEVNNLVGAFSAATVRVSGGTVDGVVNLVQSNVSQVFGRANLANILASHISSIVTGQASAGSLAVIAMTSDVAEATNDHFNGRVIIFTTGALLGQATSINTATGYIGFSNGSSRFNFPALTEAPTAGDGFLIV